jgi:hypothetical protein
VNQPPPRRSLLVAAAVAAVVGCGGDETPAPAAPPAPTFAASPTCSEEAYVARDSGGAWTHPQQNFYAPGEPAPAESDLAHLLVGDGAAIVRYLPEAPEAAREALREWAATLSSVVVVPARAADAVQVEALTSNRRLICDGVDPAQLTAFADRRGSLGAEPHGDTG